LKTKEQAIRQIISADDNIFNIISQAPQTYNTILQCQKDCGTMQQILRRRLRRMLKQNRVMRVRIPGTRFGLALYFSTEHDYKIFVYNGAIGKTRVFYMYDYKDNDNKITLNDYWELKGDNWNKWEYSSDTITFSKISFREGSCRIWE